jgi:hypothetical protein
VEPTDRRRSGALGEPVQPLGAGPLLGHLDNTTTRIYQHPTGGYREAALEAINGYLAQLDTKQLASAR